MTNCKLLEVKGVIKRGINSCLSCVFYQSCKSGHKCILAEELCIKGSLSYKSNIVHIPNWCPLPDFKEGF